MQKTNIAKSLVAAMAFASIIGSASAGNLTWQFVSRQYADFQGVLPPIVSGVMITQDNLNGRNQYDIISVTGIYGNDSITGLSNRTSRPGDPAYIYPDNAISISGTDATNGCQGVQPMWGNSPHFSCAGVSLQTTQGFINLSWGGAVAMVEDYHGNWLFAHHQITQLANSVPEPSTYAMFICGVLLLAVKRKTEAS